MLTAETLLVRPIDADKIAALITATLPALPEGETYYVSPYVAIVPEYDNCILTPDCDYDFSVSKMYIDGAFQPVFTVSVNKRIPFTTEDKLPGYTEKHACLFNLGIHTQVIPSLLKQPVSLREFMGSQYNSNPCIKKNMKDCLSEINNP